MGPGGAITTGMAFGVPPILKFGSQSLQERFLPALLTGKKRICIAITEPGAGSDVSNIQTTATRTKDGKHFLVNGTKKWITNGLWSDWASMAVRTGGPGPAGLSMLVVPLLNTPGVNMRRIKVGGQTAAGTTFIELDDVKVPVENLIGVEGMGMKYVMQNFNHERLTISIGVNRLSRVAISTAFEYCLKREAFGKTLMEQPVVRHRLAKCGAELESHWAWVEQFAYSLTKMSEEEANRELGGLTALLKAQAGRVIESCASTAILLFVGFGGEFLSYSEQSHDFSRDNVSIHPHEIIFIKQLLTPPLPRVGMDIRSLDRERLLNVCTTPHPPLSVTNEIGIYREVPGARIPGGSEDVMLDLAIRQLVKNFQRKTKELKTAMERPGGSSKL